MQAALARSLFGASGNACPCVPPPSCPARGRAPCIWSLPSVPLPRREPPSAHMDAGLRRRPLPNFLFLFITHSTFPPSSRTRPASSGGRHRPFTRSSFPLPSSTRMYPPSHPRHGHHLPGQVGHGEDGRVCARRAAAAGAGRGGGARHRHVPHEGAGVPGERPRVGYGWRRLPSPMPREWRRR